LAFRERPYRAVLVLALLPAFALPWLSPDHAGIYAAGAAWSVGWSAIYLRLLERHRARQAILASKLAGFVAKDRIAVLAANPGRRKATPDAGPVTVMSIELIGASGEIGGAGTVRNLPLAQGFEQLKDTLQRIADTVHAHGGVVDRSMGDGVIAVFGYPLCDQADTHDHASQTVNAAVALQQRSVDYITQISVGDKHKAVFPLRIGLHSGGVALLVVHSTHTAPATLTHSQRLIASSSPHSPSKVANHPLASHQCLILV